MKTRLRWCKSSVLVLLISVVACAQGQSKTVAVINGENITEDQVQQKAAPELDRLDQKRAQFLVTLERDKTKAVEDALAGIVNDKVLEAEAKKQGVTVDQLVKQAVVDRVTAPSEEQVRAFYEANRDRIDGSFIETALEIRNYMMEESRNRLFAQLLADLRGEYGFKSMLEPHRTTIETEGHPSKGPADAPVTIVEFSDFECPYCAGLFPTLQRIEENYKDRIRIVYRQFPLNNIHPRAQKAAEASLCANDQKKFWELHDAMFEDQTRLRVDDLKERAAELSMDLEAFSTCLDTGKYAAEVRESIVEGAEAGVDGTPALFINGRFLGGNQPYGEIEKIIEDELLRSGR